MQYRAYRLGSIGKRPALAALLAILLLALAMGVAYAAPIVLVDDKGADDLPGQKDLNFLSVDYAPPVAGTILVKWGWDDTAWSGNNTGDACSLFDTDADGFANYSLCATVAGTPATFKSTRLYSCGDARSDRCTQPTLISNQASTATAAVEANSDPFGVPSSPYYMASHVSGNTCGSKPGCYTADTVANVTVRLSDVGGGSAKLINVCSYPSQEPNSDPSECVITPNSGFLTIVKSATPNDGTPFVFNMGAGQASQSGVSSWTINGSGSIQLISFPAGTAYDLSEVVPTGWSLTSAACSLQTSPVSSTGAFSSPTISDFEIRSGLETICTFTNQKADVKIEKTAVSATINAGGNAAFNIVVTNIGSGPANNVTVSDTLPAGVNWSENSDSCSIAGGLLSCNFGTLAAGATASVQVSGTAPAAVCGTLTNTATVTAANDGNSANNSSTATITVNCPDVTVVKTAVSGTINAGETAAFNITVTNSGTGTATGVTLTDLLPSGIAWTENSALCDIAGGVLSCNFGDLGAGASESVQVSGTAPATACGTLTNTATVAATNEANTSNNSSTATITVNCPDLTVVKTAESDIINAGDPAVFNITVTNSGAGTAYGVTLTDSLPAGINWTEDSAFCGIAGGTLSCNFGDLIAGASASVQVSGTAPATVCGPLTNTATVAATNEANTSNNSSTATITVNCPNVAVVKTAISGTINAGDTAIFDITVTNSGPGAAYNVTLTDTLPGALGWTENSESCEIAAGVLSCDFGTLPAGGSATVQVSAVTSAAACGTLNNTALVAVGNEPASANTDNSSTASIVVLCGALTIQKTPDAPSVNAGDNIGFLITVSNTGAGAAYGVTLTDVLPTGDGLNWTLDGGTGAGSCSIAGGSLSCNFGTVPGGSSVTVHVSSPTTPASCAVVNNSASVTSTNDGSGTANASVTVNCPNVIVSKTADNGEIDAGETAAFTIVVSNAGAGTAYNVTLSDTLPAGVTWAQDNDACSITGSVLSCAFGSLAPGASETIHVTGATSTAVCGTLDNMVQVAASNEANTSDNVSRASIAVACASLKVTKVVNWSGTTPDADQEFQICVTGPSFASPSCQMTSGGDLVWEPLLPGEYSVTETNPGADWVVTPPSQSVDVTTSEQATATVNNRLRTFKVVVVVCEETPDTLYPSLVELLSGTFTTASGADASACALPGVGGLRSGTYTPSVNIVP